MSHRVARLLASFVVVVVTGAGTGSQAAAAQSGSSPTTPTLVVLITVDQFRADYLDRFGAQFTGGLARLTRDGAVFTDAHHDHAITETAPGHATLLAGRYPRSTGITMNSVGVADDAAPLIAGGIGAGASPRRFVGSTLVDWLHDRDARSRTLSVSVKDRGAILPVGRSRADVFWYSPDGRFITSKYYRDSLPPWVVAFNARRLPHRYAGTAWSLLLPESAYPEVDSTWAESGGAGIAFPHWVPRDSMQAASLVRVTPFVDEVTLAFALQGVRDLALGTGPQTDVLAVSLSATDFIGHSFGPDSREMRDQILRIDRMLGVFLDSLHRLRDPSRVVVAFTSDHGVSTIPEIAASSTVPSARRVELESLLRPIRATLRAAGVDTLAVDFEQQLVLVDRAAFRSSRMGADSLITLVAGAARRAPGVRRVDRVPELFADSLRDPVARRWSHQLPPATPVALVVTLDSLSTWGGNVASHGSSYDQDSHVPLILMGTGVRAGRLSGFVRTVDLAPTLAAMTGATPRERLDGVILTRALIGVPSGP